LTGHSPDRLAQEQSKDSNTIDIEPFQLAS
jgi:hypothetical protein